MVDFEKVGPDEGIKVIINGIEKDTVQNSSIIDFGWFVRSIASREGIKDFTMKVNGEAIALNDIKNVKIPNVRTLELSTFDVARRQIKID